MKITIVNQHTNNFGDEAAGIALVEELKKRYNPEIHIIYNGDGKIHIDGEKIYHENSCKLKHMGYINIALKVIFHKYKGNKAMQNFDNLIKNSDYIFVAPCGANIGIYKDWRFLTRLLFVVFCEKKPTFYLNTIGKSDSWIFNRVATYILKRSSVYVREKKSEEYLNTIPIKCKRGIDTAFLLNVPETKKIYNGKYIVFVPTNFNNHANFKGKDSLTFINNNIIDYLCKYAIDNEYKIVILPHLNTNDELCFLKKIENQIKDRNYKNVKIAHVKSIYDYCNIIKNSMLVFGMRYHSIVLAAKFNIPFISLAYENKMVEVSEYTGMSKCCLKMYDHFDKREIEKVITYIDNNRNEIIKSLNENNTKIIKKATMPLEVIDYE